MIGESDGCVDATSTCITAAWKSFRQLLPIITKCGISPKRQHNISSSCIRKSLLYGCKRWSTSSQTISCLTSADSDMFAGSVLSDLLTQELHEKPGIISVTEEI